MIARGVIDSMALTSGSLLLDFGCGYALGTRLYLEQGVELLLCDHSSHYRDAVTVRFGDHRGVTILEPRDLDSIDAGTVDVILVYSVIQYLTDEELRVLFRRACRLLCPTGALLLGDVIPPETQILTDLKDFLPRGGGVGGAAKRLRDSLLLAGSRYPALRRKLGLRRFGDELKPLLKAEGLDGTRRTNIGPNQSRSTWVARPIPS